MKDKKTQKEWVDHLIQFLGGRDNIVSVTHCLTRLRFILNDLNLPQIQEIEKLQGVKGTFKSSGMFQVIIGNDVPKYFKIILENSDIPSASKEVAKREAIKKQKGAKVLSAINYLGEIFIPIIPVLVAGGIILGLRNIFAAEFNGWSMIHASQFMQGLYDFLWIPAQACFFWLPVHICWSIFKKMGADEVLGIVIGLTLLIPPLINAYDAIGNSKDNIWIWDIANALGDDGSFDFGFMQYPWKIQYTAQVIPAFAIGIVGAYINLWIRRVTPGYLNQIAVPLVTILSSFILAMFAVGPAGFIIGSAVGFAFKWALTDTIAKYFFGLIIGLVYAPIVITGVHHIFNAVFVQETISNGGSFLFMATCAQSIAQGAAVLGWIIMNKKNPKVKDIGAPAIVSAWLGVTEPAMYGINIRYMYPFVAACIGAAFGTELAVISGTSSFNSGNGAWLGILNVQAQSEVNGVTTWAGTGYTWFMISMLATTGITILMTILLSKVKWFKKFDIEISAANTMLEAGKTKKAQTKEKNKKRVPETQVVN